MREFYCYQLQERRTQGNTLFRGGRLFQQYIVDAYASVEEDRLDYIRKNQKICDPKFIKEFKTLLQEEIQMHKQ